VNKDNRILNLKFAVPMSSLVQPNQTFKITINKDKIQDFLNDLQNQQFSYIEAAVEKSGFKEANEVIKYIMEKK
jgi:hypothetical protein